MLAAMPSLAGRFAALLSLLVWCGCGAAEKPGDCSGALDPIAVGFGARGPHAVAVESIPNPRRPDQRVSAFVPIAAPAPFPVVLFAHANEQGDPAIYAALLDHIASRG
jgi:hypothetical protein